MAQSRALRPIRSIAAGWILNSVQSHAYQPLRDSSRHSEQSATGHTPHHHAHEADLGDQPDPHRSAMVPSNGHAGLLSQCGVWTVPHVVEMVPATSDRFLPTLGDVHRRALMPRSASGALQSGQGAVMERYDS